MAKAALSLRLTNTSSAGHRGFTTTHNTSNTPPRVEPVAVETYRGELPAAVRAAVTAIAARAEAADGAPPLSDSVLLGTDPATIHLWLASDDAVAGYAAVTSDASAISDLANSAHGTIEIVVDPQLRGRGLGAQLLPGDQLPRPALAAVISAGRLNSLRRVRPRSGRGSPVAGKR